MAMVQHPSSRTNGGKNGIYKNFGLYKGHPLAGSLSIYEVAPCLR